MNIAQPTTSQIGGVSFTLFNSKDVRELSVQQIVDPRALNDLGTPNLGGLYDPHLGPLDRGDVCATCSLDDLSCPGHFGHIELAATVIHPLLLEDVYGLIRACCMYCHHLRLDPEFATRAIFKLRLLRRGFLAEAVELDDWKLRNANSGLLDLLDDDNEEAVEDNHMALDDEDEDRKGASGVSESVEQFRKRLEAYYSKVTAGKSISPDNYKTTTLTSELTETIRRVLSMARKAICPHCKGVAHTIRRDGHSRLLIEPLNTRKATAMMKRGRVVMDVINPKESTVTPPHSPVGSEDEQAEFGSDAESVAPTERGDDSDTETAPPTTNKKARGPAGRTMLTPLHVRNHFRLLHANEHELLDELFGIHGPLAQMMPTQIPAPIPSSARRTLRQVVESPARSDCFFLDVIAVPPNRFRPPAMTNGRKTENQQNSLLSNILTMCQNLRNINQSLAGRPGSDGKLRAPPSTAALYMAWANLQQAVNNLIDSSRGAPRLRDQDPIPGVRQLLERKEGLFRMNMMGKRVNYTARSVISPDPNLETNEVGLPPVFAQRLTFPEPVTHFNVHVLRRAVINGPTRWPGATFVQAEDGTLTDLSRLTVESRTALANQLLTPQDPGSVDVEAAGETDVFAPRTLGVNKKVFRHVRNGDFLLLNRQPTLHKPSIMAHRARVLAGEKTIRMHYANCKTYNADFDGDEMNLHYPQNELARAEAALIAANDLQYLVPTSGNPLRGLIQDHVVMGTLMTKRDTFFTRAEYHQLLYGSLRPEEDPVGNSDRRLLLLPPTVWKPQPLWTGKQVISTLLRNMTYGRAPANLTSKSKVPGATWGPGCEEGEVIVVDGELVCGILDKSQFGDSAFGLVHHLHELYGPHLAGRMLSVLSRLFTKYLQMRAFTCRMDDLRLTPEGDRARRAALADSKACGTEVAVQHVGLGDVVKDPAAMSPAERREFHVRMEEVLRDDMKMRALDAVMKNRTSKITTGANKAVMPVGLLRPFPKNHMQTMVITGAKGGDVNTQQISVLLGQQELEGRRVPVMVSGKSLPSFRPFDTSVRAGGFIAGRFFTGIKPQEYYFHCMAGREGLIDTAVKTANSGYLQRCLIKHLEGITVQYDHTVRDADGSLIQFLYGEDSLDVIKQKHLHQFDFAAANYAALREKLNPAAVVDAVDVDTAGPLAREALKRPAHPPVLSYLSPSRYLGSVSEQFDSALRNYVRGNKAGLLSSGKHGNPRRGPLGAMAHDDCTKRSFRALMEIKYMHSLVDPGEAVGLLAAQGVGEPSTQMTLNTFHFAGFGAKNVTLGIPRLREIVMTASREPKTPSMTLDIKSDVSDEEAERMAKSTTRVVLGEVIDSVQVTERLTRRADSIDGSRTKRYTLRVNMYDRDAIASEYRVTSEEVEECLELKFLPRLVSLIQRTLKNAKGPAIITRKVQAGDVANLEYGEDDSDKIQRATESDSDEENDAKAARVSGKVRKPTKTAEKGGKRDAPPGDQDEDTDAGDSEEEGSENEDGGKQEHRRRLRETNASDNEQSDVGDAEDELDADLAELARAARSASGLGNALPDYSVAANRGSRKKATSGDRSKRVLATVKQVTRYEFDQQRGAWCEFDLEYSAGTGKLLLTSLAEKAASLAVIREVPKIKRCFRLAPESESDTRRQLATDGVNLRAAWGFGKVIDVNSIESNDIYAVLLTYGVEAARSAIVKEISSVFKVYGIAVNDRHISLIADYMTFEGGYKPFNRMGIASSTSPFGKMSFESTCTFLKAATLYGDYDTLQNPSARIVMGKAILAGTGAPVITQELP
ncbi:hypothetical protein IWQ60_005983 [Tieghemiomyces parasiticus]|uniref:DNA-directed RNA polymerase subunit n=1 Tax=Tieghemiomyces parasiticus TaxID=78921 RepID=A0A9W8ADR3_9FUNG|nr:hypothetical protein IWQ60_005983 [Tieghemiomyces parasiticus]